MNPTRGLHALPQPTSPHENVPCHSFLPQNYTCHPSLQCQTSARFTETCPVTCLLPPHSNLPHHMPTPVSKPTMSHAYQLALPHPTTCLLSILNLPHSTPPCGTQTCLFTCPPTLSNGLIHLTNGHPPPNLPCHMLNLSSLTAQPLAYLPYPKLACQTLG